MMFLPHVILFMYVFCPQSYSRSLSSTSTNDVNLGSGVKVAWTLHMKDGGSLIMNIEIRLPELYRWIAVGFRNIPFKHKHWDDMALITIEKDRQQEGGQEVSFLKTIHLDKVNEISDSKWEMYEWAENGRKKSDRTYYFTLERQLKHLETCKAVTLDWAYGYDTLKKGYPNFLAERLQSKTLVLDESRSFQCVPTGVLSNNNEDVGSMDGMDPSIEGDNQQGSNLPTYKESDQQGADEDEKWEKPAELVGNTEVMSEKPGNEDANPADMEDNQASKGVGYEKGKGNPEENEETEETRNSEVSTSDNNDIGQTAVASSETGNNEGNVTDKSTDEAASASQEQPNNLNVPANEMNEQRNEFNEQPTETNEEPSETNEEPSETTELVQSSSIPKLMVLTTEPYVPTKERTVTEIEVEVESTDSTSQDETLVTLSKTTTPARTISLVEAETLVTLSKTTTPARTISLVEATPTLAGKPSEEDVARCIIHPCMYNQCPTGTICIPNYIHCTSACGDNTTESAAKTICSCVPTRPSHWYNFFKDNENSVYFVVIGVSALFTGAIVLCLACCCANKSRKLKIPRNIRKSKVSFYKVDDFESSADEEVEFLQDEEGDDIKNLVKGPVVETKPLRSAFGVFKHYSQVAGR